MKPVTWIGNSRSVVQTFSPVARREAGYQLYRVQMDRMPTDCKPMKSIGAGAYEIRIHAESEYRVIYVAKFGDTIGVLHAFRKTTRRTSKLDIDVAKARYRALIRQTLKS